MENCEYDLFQHFIVSSLRSALLFVLVITIPDVLFGNAINKFSIFVILNSIRIRHRVSIIPFKFAEFTAKE